MRGVGLLVSIVLFSAVLAPGAAGQTPAVRVALVDVSHALTGGTLEVSGWVENRGTEPVSRLVIDALGFAPSGEQVAFGSDGVPWEMVPGAVEHFSISLFVPNQLIRDYVVRVTLAQTPSRPLATTRRFLDLELYRPLMLSRVSVRGAVFPGELFVRSITAGLPVARVTVEASVVLFPFTTDKTELPLLQRLTLDVPAGGSISVPLPLGVRDAFLVTLRVVDLLLSTSWGN